MTRPWRDGVGEKRSQRYRPNLQYLYWLDGSRHIRQDIEPLCDEKVSSLGLLLTKFRMRLTTYRSFILENFTVYCYRVYVLDYMKRCSSESTNFVAVTVLPAKDGIGRSGRGLSPQV